MKQWFWTLINHVDTEKKADAILKDMKDHSDGLCVRFQQFAAELEQPTKLKTKKKRLA